MVERPTTPLPEGFSQENATAVGAIAHADAERLCAVLDRLGIKASKDKPIILPLNFLCHLSAALRLHLWEMQGCFFHREAGLPAARQAIDDAFQVLKTPNSSDSLRFWHEVGRLSIDRLAWSGPSELGVEVAILEDIQEDVLLEALADFLWTRHLRSRLER